VAPRAQRGRPHAWAPSSVHEALYRELYRGVIVWNQTRKRNVWGQHAQTARPASEVIRIPAPELQIVSDSLWEASHDRLRADRDRYLRATDGRLWGRPKDVESKYLLTGLVRCGWCGGGIYVKTRDHRSRRAGFYGCSSYHKRGGTVCGNHLELPLDTVDSVVLDAIAEDVLCPDIVEEAIARTMEARAPERRARDAERVRDDLHGVEAELARFAQAIAAGVPVEALVTATQERQRRRDALILELAGLERATPQIDLAGIRTRLEGKLADWRGLLRSHVTQARQILRKLLPEPIILTPHDDLRGAVLKGTALLDTLTYGLFPGAMPFLRQG
jgi:hypothetical protein